MKSQSNYYGKNQSEITEATGQLRIELRIYSSKLNYHNKKINGDFFADIFNLSHKFGEDLKSYLGIMFGTGRIITIEKAKTIIEQSSHHRETKDKMIEIIKNTSHKDMDFAFRRLRYPEKSRFIKYFNNLDISPITVPKVWKTEFKSPIDYIETNNVNQR